MAKVRVLRDDSILKENGCDLGMNELPDKTRGILPLGEPIARGIHAGSLNAFLLWVDSLAGDPEDFLLIVIDSDRTHDACDIVACE